MSRPTQASESSIMVPPVDVIYEDEFTGEIMQIRVKTTIKDRTSYEVHAHRSGWPTERPMQTAMFLWTGFLAWSALRRSPDAPAQLKTKTPDEFLDAVLDVVPVVEEDAIDVVDPTLPAPGSEAG